MDKNPLIVVCFLVASSLGGCHVTSRVDSTLAGKTRYKLHADQRLVLAPRVEITKTGRLRLVEPIACKRDILVEQITHRTKQKKPNLATVVVGIISTAAGAVALLSNLGNSSSVLVGTGIAGIGIGVPLVVGPFTGNRRSRKLLDTTLSPRGRDYKRCDTRPVKATNAMLSYGNVKALATVDGRGELSVAIFDLVDAFAVHKLPAVEIDVVAGNTKFHTMLAASEIAAGREGFFKAMNVDPRKRRLSMVPRPMAESLTVTRIRRDGRVAIEVRVRVANKGPGDAWGVRGLISSDDPEIDGRVLYVGQLPAKASRTAAVTIGLSADRELTETRISVLLLDFHGTTRSVPLKFRGPILNAM